MAGRPGIRAKLSAALLLAVVLAAGASAWVAVHVYGAFSEDTTHRELVVARRTVQAVLDLRQEAALGHAEVLAQRDDVRAAIVARDREALVRLGRRCQQEHGLDVVVITDAAGVVLARGHAPAQYGDDASEFVTVRGALHGLALATIRRAPIIRLGATGGAPVFERRPPYRVMGTVTVGFGLGQSFVADLKKTIGFDVSFILDGARYVTTLPSSHAPHPVALAETGAPGETPPVDLRVGREEYRAVYTALRGRDGRAAVGGIEIAKDLRGEKAARARVVWTIAGAVSLLSVGILGIGLWLSARITGPLSRLMRAAGGVGSGDLGHRVQVDGDDEVARLALAFNEMTEGIERAQAEVSASEERFRDLYENAPIAYFSAGPDDLIRRCNREAVELTGRMSTEDLVGRPATDLYADTACGKEKAAVIRARAFRGEEVRGEELQMKRADGTLIWISLTVNTVRDAGGAILETRSIVADITERKRAEEQRQGLARVASGLTGSLDVSEIGPRIVNSVVPLLRAHSAGLSLLHPDGSLETLAVSDPPGRYSAPGEVLPAGVGISARVIASRQAESSADLLAEPDLVVSGSLRRRIEESGEGARLAVPLRAGGQVIGVLSVADATGRQFSEAEATLLQVFADQAALALENARLFGEEARERREADLLARVASAMSASLTLDTVLQRVAEAAHQLCASDMSRVALRVPGSEAMRFRHGVGFRAPGWDTTLIEPGKGFGGRVLLTGRPARTENYEQDPAVGKEYLDLAREEGVVTGLVVPVRIRGRAEGLLFVFNGSPRVFTDRDERVLVRLAHHAAIAIANAALYERVNTSGERLRVLSRRLMEVREDEQRALARELHDELGQSLTALRITLETVQGAPGGGASSSCLGEAIRLADEVLGQVRALSLHLRPSVLDDLGLVPALRWYLQRQGQRTGLDLRLEADLGKIRLPPGVETVSFRVVQEALTNAARHSGASRVEVVVALRDGQVLLVVRDNGRGFDVDAARARARHGESLGLLGMEERVVLLGGRIDIVSAAGRGTEISVRLPLAGEPDILAREGMEER